MDILASVKGIHYTPLICRNLTTYRFEDLKEFLSEARDATFILDTSRGKVAVSWWVSAKRTRSYPYARVYDSLGFPGKRITIIPIFKDEGKEGDRDFLQWDTVSLMSLLNVFVIISYYNVALRSSRYSQKITHQIFDITHLKNQLEKLLSYQSDALHWNIDQVSMVGSIAEKALTAYERISRKLRVPMHSSRSALKRIEELQKEKSAFMFLSRGLAIAAQRRETLTIQPKEKLSGSKASITIRNYLGGCYYFTVDEAELDGKYVRLIEGKYSKTKLLPSEADIKEGLLKMILYTNLTGVRVSSIHYIPVPVLKLVGKSKFKQTELSSSQLELLKFLEKEAAENSFMVQFG